MDKPLGILRKINKIRNEKEELASNRTETQMLLVIVTQKGNKMDN